MGTEINGPLSLTDEVLLSSGFGSEISSGFLEATSIITNQYAKWRVAIEEVNTKIDMCNSIVKIAYTIVIFCGIYSFYDAFCYLIDPVEYCMAGNCLLQYNSTMGINNTYRTAIFRSIIVNRFNMIVLCLYSALVVSLEMYIFQIKRSLKKNDRELNSIMPSVLARILRGFRLRAEKTKALVATDITEAVDITERIIRGVMGLLGAAYLCRALEFRDILYGLSNVLHLRHLIPRTTRFAGFGYDAGITFTGKMGQWYKRSLTIFGRGFTGIIVYPCFKVCRFVVRMYNLTTNAEIVDDRQNSYMDEEVFSNDVAGPIMRSVERAADKTKLIVPTALLSLAGFFGIMKWRKSRKQAEKAKKRKVTACAIIAKKDAESQEQRPSDAPRTWTLNDDETVPAFHSMNMRNVTDEYIAPVGKKPTVAIDGSPLFVNVNKSMKALLQVGSMYSASAFVSANSLITAGHCLTEKNGKLGVWVRNPDDEYSWLWNPLNKEFRHSLGEAYTDSVAICHLHYKLANHPRVTVSIAPESGPIMIPVWINGLQSTWGISTGEFYRWWVVNGNYLAMSATIHGGTSGAPVFNTTGSAIGVVSCECQTLNENYAIGFNSEIVAFLKGEHTDTAKKLHRTGVVSGFQRRSTMIGSDSESSIEEEYVQAGTSGQKQIRKWYYGKSGSTTGNQDVRAKRPPGGRKEKKPPKEGHGDNEFPSVQPHNEIPIVQPNPQ